MNQTQVEEIKALIDYCITKGNVYLSIYLAPDGGSNISVYPAKENK